MRDLRSDVGDDGDKLSKIFGIRGDARDDAPGGEFVVEGKVMLGCCTESICAQVENHIADGAGGDGAACPVDAPVEHADQKNAAADE